MEALLTSILEGVFFVLFGVVVVRYLRRPTPLDRDVLAVFASVAGLFFLGIVSRFVPDFEPITTVAAVALMAQPYLTIRLIRHFTLIPAWLHVAVLLAFIAAAAWVVVGVTGNGRIGLLYVVGYFVVVNAIAAVGFLRAGRARVGPARTRLALAGIATLFLGASVLIAGAAAAASTGTGGPSAGATAARLVALAAGFGYLVAFVPPRFLRRIQRQATAFELNQELLALPSGSSASVMWQRLASAARRVTGGRASVVIGAGSQGQVLAADGDWEPPPVVGASLGRVPPRDGGGPRVVTDLEGPFADLARAAGASSAITVPLKGPSGRRGDLVVFIQGSELFVDDDVAVLTLLGSRTIAAIEREEAFEERSALVETLRRTNEELARASAAKSDFLAAMSHELRTPLNSIIGFSELLMAPVTSADTRRSLDVVDQAGHIHSAGIQLLDLINEVLDLARIEAGRLELRYDRFDLGGLVRRTVDAMAPVASQRSVAIDLVEDGDATVEADPGRIRQVVYNILSNAIKFSPEGGRVRVTVSVSDGAAAVTIADEGPGIPVEEQGQLFEAFAQGQQGLLRSEGAGLGLALSRQLAEAHGGRIDLSSEPGSGSTFTLRIPTRRPVVATEVSTRSADRHVLVIEDDPGMVALLRSWLEPEGYNVSSAPNGADGLRLARALAPDAIMLDILLPDIDGWDVLQQLRLERRTRDVPILVLSVLEDRQLGLALGAADYLVKPVEREQLLDRLRWITRDRSDSGPAIVLAIDPDESSLAAYRAALDGTARVVEARSASEARAAARAGADMILLDLGLADDPFALLVALKEHPATRDTPVLALTTHPLSDDDKQRLTGQVAAIVQKQDVSGALGTWLTGLPSASWTERAVTA